MTISSSCQLKVCRSLCVLLLSVQTQDLLCCCDDRTWSQNTFPSGRRDRHRSPPPLSNQKQSVFIFWTIRTIDRSMMMNPSGKMEYGIYYDLCCCVFLRAVMRISLLHKSIIVNHLPWSRVECSSGSPSHKWLYSIRRVQGCSRCLYRRVACGSAKWFFLTFHYAPELGNYYAAFAMEA